MTLANKLRRLRKERCLTQDEAAQKIGVSTRTYKNYELGNTCPRTRSIYVRIADFYEVDIDDLLMLGSRFISDNIHSDMGEEDADAVIQKVVMMFAGGRMSEKDKDLALQAILKAYWDAKNDGQ